MGERSPARTTPDPNDVAKRVRTLPQRFVPDTVDGLAAEWELRIGDRPYTVRVADGACSVRDGGSNDPVAVMSADAATWLAMDEGSTPPVRAFLDGNVRVSGNLELAVRFQTLFRRYRRRRRAADLRVEDVEVEGIRLSSYVAGAGDGTPLLFLHGLGGSKVSWLPILPDLAEGRRVVAPDLPGHGSSAKPKDDYTPRSYAHLARVLLDALGLDAAIVVGNSMGGRIGLELALRSPKRVRGLALLDPAIPGLRWRAVMGFTRVVPTEIGAISFPLRRRWTELAVRRLFAHPERLPPDAIRIAADEFIRIYADPQARLAFLASLRHLLTERPAPFLASMRRVRQPALVIFGEHDRIVAPKLGTQLVEHLPNARLHLLPEVGHVPQFEAAPQTIELLRGFFEDVDAVRPRAT